jgi:hypothetical protein
MVTPVEGPVQYLQLGSLAVAPAIVLASQVCLTMLLGWTLSAFQVDARVETG